jgi:hypothetical protein
VKLCECGCGQPAPIASKTSRSDGRVKGQPSRFVHGHHNRVASLATRAKISAGATGRVLSPETRAKIGARLRRDDVGYSAAHIWLNRHHPKTGTCEECGVEVGATGQAGTHYAYTGPNGGHERDRSKYRELCPACHTSFDNSKTQIAA